MVHVGPSCRVWTRYSSTRGESGTISIYILTEYFICKLLDYYGFSFQLSDRCISPLHANAVLRGPIASRYYLCIKVYFKSEWTDSEIQGLVVVLLNLVAWAPFGLPVVWSNFIYSHSGIRVTLNN